MTSTRCAPPSLRLTARVRARARSCARHTTFAAWCVVYLALPWVRVTLVSAPTSVRWEAAGSENVQSLPRAPASADMHVTGETPLVRNIVEANDSTNCARKSAFHDHEIVGL